MNKNRGFILYLVLFATLSLSILVLMYLQSARFAGEMSFRLEQSEVLRQIAVSAADEAFAVLHQRSENSGNPESRWFLENTRKVRAGTPAQPFVIEVPLTSSQMRSMVRPYLDPEIKVLAEVFDGRGNDSKGNEYYQNESVGTVQMTVSVALKHRGKPAGSCVLTRHHDFKINSLISQEKRGSQYVQNFPLSYVLLVRDGYREFSENQGKSLNNSNVRLVVKEPSLAEKRRKN